MSVSGEVEFVVRGPSPVVRGRIHSSCRSTCSGFFRIFSRNLARRRAENQRFVNWWWRMKSSRQGARERHADKDHKYFTCKNCRTICRVPVGKGNIVITCPKCGAQIRART